MELFRLVGMKTELRKIRLYGGNYEYKHKMQMSKYGDELVPLRSSVMSFRNINITEKFYEFDIKLFTKDTISQIFVHI